MWLHPKCLLYSWTQPRMYDIIESSHGLWLFQPISGLRWWTSEWHQLNENGLCQFVTHIKLQTNDWLMTTQQTLPISIYHPHKYLVQAMVGITNILNSIFNCIIPYSIMRNRIIKKKNNGHCKTLMNKTQMVLNISHFVWLRVKLKMLFWNLLCGWNYHFTAFSHKQCEKNEHTQIEEREKTLLWDDIKRVNKIGNCTAATWAA